MIEVKHLRLIEAVAKHGTLKKASEELFLTAPALSHQLKELESRLGVEIFHRVNNKLYFTPAGKEIRDSGYELLEKLGELEQRLKEISKDQLDNYVHGFSEEETERLKNQASSISNLLHWDSQWEDGSLVLEAGCGVGAQTRIIASNNPNVKFVSFDLSNHSLKNAKKLIDSIGLNNVTFKQADVLNLPFEDDLFDHVFVCFVMEHLSDREKALAELKRVLKKGGTLTVIEGDHGSTYFYPESTAARKAIQTQVDLQKRNGGNANIGRELYPMLRQAGFIDIQVEPRQVYVDESNPEMMDSFVKNTFTAMIKGIKEEALAKKMISNVELDEGIADLLKTTEKGTFCYTFFKAVAKIG